MSTSLFNKTAEEAIEALANRYIEIQIKAANKETEPASKTDNSQPSSGMSTNTASAIIGGLAGAGIGGLGSLGYNYLKGKRLKAKDVLYGALMGAVPGASLGYLAGGSENSAGGSSDGSGGKGIGSKALDATNAALIVGTPAALGYRYAPGKDSSLLKGKSNLVLALEGQLDKELAKSRTNPRAVSRVESIQKSLNSARELSEKNPSQNVINLFGKQRLAASAPKVRAGYRGFIGLLSSIPAMSYLLSNSQDNSK